MWARIENNIVKEVVDTDPEGRFTSDLIFVKCDETIKEHYTYENNVFTPPNTSVSLVEQAARESILANKFLQDSDIKLLRRLEEIALGQTPHLSDVDYTSLLQQRQLARAKLIKT